MRRRDERGRRKISLLRRREWLSVLYVVEYKVRRCLRNGFWISMWRLLVISIRVILIV